LDERWAKAVHLPGEKCCHYLLSSGKVGAEVRYADDPVFQACKVALPLVEARHPIIAHAVAVAAKSGFKGEHLRRRKGQKHVVPLTEQVAADPTPACGTDAP
jgi:hypothetical protein